MLAASTTRALAIRQRPDLVTRAQVYAGRRFYVIKDPLNLHYFRFQEEEFALLSWLDGRTSAAQLKERFDREFAPQQISASELQQFIGMLHRAALVVSDAPGQAEQLLTRGRERAEQATRERWSNFLAFRFRGFNPDRLLTWLNAQVGWLFSLPLVLCACLLGISALVLLGSQFDLVRARLPGFHEFFTLQNWFWLSLTLASVKVLHELGHGIACKRLGGECHEMGVMLLIFSPCLYANVSDAWTLPNKWHRAAIGAAGMYVELILASLATFLWWSTQPGLVHYLALDVMFVCSVSTLLFNANPLLRFDGYYILCDLCEVPNLRTKASKVLQIWLSGLCLGLRAPHDPFLPKRHRWLLASYAVAAACYGWFVTASILWTLWKMFEPTGFKVVGMLMAAVMIYAIVVRPLRLLAALVIAPERMTSVNKVRAAISGALLLALLVGVMWLPLPRYVTTSVLVEPSAATAVYVDVAGQVREILAPPNARVAAGTPILRLESVELELELARLRSEHALMAARLEGLRERALVDDHAAQLLTSTEEALAALDEQCRRKETEQKRLVIVAPAEGVLVPPARRAAADERGRLNQWSGHPLQPQNIGAHLATGTVIGQIGSPDALHVVLPVDETEIDFVRAGQRVEIILDQRPHERWTTTIDALSAERLEIAPASLSTKAGGQIATQTDRHGHERPLRATYQASAALDRAHGGIVAGGRGTARIATGTEALGTRAWRELARMWAWQL